MDQSIYDTEFLFESVNSSSNVRSTEFFDDNLIYDDNNLFNSSVSSTSSDYDELLSKVEVTNSLLGISIALQIFFFAFVFMVFFIKIIKNNVTNLID